MKITNISEVPTCSQRAAKVALAIGADVHLDNAGDLLVSFAGADRYFFDPENVTTHVMEALEYARLYGFMCNGHRVPLIVRIEYSNEDVRVQIGASLWYHCAGINAAAATRRAIVDAFCAYYDEMPKA